MKRVLACAILIYAMVFVGCTQQQQAQNLEGPPEIDLPAGSKLVTAAIEHGALHFITRPMREGEVAEDSRFFIHFAGKTGVSFVFREHGYGPPKK